MSDPTTPEELARKIVGQPYHDDSREEAVADAAALIAEYTKSVAERAYARGWNDADAGGCDDV